MEIKTVTVIGATGTMGVNAVGIFASFGNAKVYMVGRNLDSLNKAKDRAVASVRAGSIYTKLEAVSFDRLEECVKKSDLVFESVSEDIDIKKEVARRVATALRPDAYSCTGTSGLSITKLAECYPENLRENFYGVHIFNPPYTMPLCELTETKYSKDNKTKELEEYLSNTLYRTVVHTKDSPAFLGNRIGFFIINKAMQLAEEFKKEGGIDYIDSILGPFTGRAMAPLSTADFVGLDVHKAIVDNIYANTEGYMHDSFKLPGYAKELIDQNMLGKKTNGGLYKTVTDASGNKHKLVYDIESKEYREAKKYDLPFASAMKTYIASGEYTKAFDALVKTDSKESNIALKCLCDYVEYSLYVAKEISKDFSAADDVMATGFNWCPPVALYHVLKKLGVSFNISYDVPGSKYDYRTYFKAK